MTNTGQRRSEYEDEKKNPSSGGKLGSGRPGRIYYGHLSCQRSRDVTFIKGEFVCQVYL